MSLKIRLPIWVFILVTAIGIAVIILLFQYGSLVLNEMRLQSLEDAYRTKTIPQKEKLSDWKTYRDYRYGFEFEYPTDWNVSTGAESVADVFKNGILYTSLRFSIIPPGDLYPETTGIVVSHALLDYDNQPIDVQWSAIRCKSDEKDCTVFKNGNGVSIVKYSYDDNNHGQHDFLAYVATGKIILAFYEELGIDDKDGIKTMGKIFNQILSTFKFIEPITLRPTTKYGIFGDDEFDTVVWGYVLIEKEDQFGTMTDIAYFIITEYLHEEFKNAIQNGINKGNTLNKKFGGKFGFRLGCFANNKIEKTAKTGENIEQNVNQAILNSKPEDPIGIILSFEEHAGMGCDCCSLAEKISLY